MFRSPDPFSRREGVRSQSLRACGGRSPKIQTITAIPTEQRAKLLDVLSDTYNDLGLYTEAIAADEKAVNYYLASHGPEDAQTLRTMAGLAVTYSEAGRVEDATKLREKVLTLRRKVNGLTIMKPSRR